MGTSINLDPDVMGTLRSIKAEIWVKEAKNVKLKDLLAEAVTLLKKRYEQELEAERP